MRIGLTKYGRPEVVVYPLAIVAAMAAAHLLRGFVSPDWAWIVVEAVLFVVLIWVFSFFRDPCRKVPEGDGIFVSPADGRVSDVEMIKDKQLCEHKVLRIGIFLSVFNVHINRVPCAAKIEKITYKPGKYLNALKAESVKVNEANDIIMTRLAEPTDKVKVRQISGAIARRIVCPIEVGQEFTSGQQFGMIKFGSRTELYIPLRDNLKCEVKVGDKVKAGLTIMARYENE